MNQIKWLRTENEDTKCFIYAEIQIANEKRLIRFAIDKKTLSGFATVLSQKPFKEKYGSNYTYWYSGYSVDNSEKEYVHYIEIKLESMRNKAKVQCSEFFCQNLKWLTSIESVSELSELIIK
jgi:hypothetical protein